MTPVRSVVIVGAGFIISLVFAVVMALWISEAAAQQQQAPYSCRLYWDEQQKHAYGAQNERELERLRNECIKDGGHP